MATVTITAREAEDGLLPPVCVLTGGRTGDQIEHEFECVPRTLFLLSLCVPFGRLIRRISAREMTVTLPMKGRFHWHWRWRSMVMYGLLVLCLITAGAGVLCQHTLPQLTTAVSVAGLALLLAFFVMAGVYTVTTIRAVDISDDGITLTNVHPKFAAALDSFREREGEERRRLRRRRKAGGEVWDDRGY